MKTLKVTAHLVTQDVLPVNPSQIVKPVTESESNHQPVSVHLVLMKTNKESVNHVLQNVLNVKMMLTSVPFVLITENQELNTCVHV
jgi:hypothetical protein